MLLGPVCYLAGVEWTWAFPLLPYSKPLPEESEAHRGQGMGAGSPE